MEPIVLICFLAFLGYWRDEWPLHLITGLTWMTYGGYYVATTQYLGFALILFGLYTFYRGMMLRRGK